MANRIVVVIDYSLNRDPSRRRSLKSRTTHKLGIIEVVIADAHFCLHVTYSARGGARARTVRCRWAISFLVDDDVLNEVWLVEILELQLRNRSPQLISHRPHDRIGWSLLASRYRRRNKYADCYRELPLRETFH